MLIFPLSTEDTQSKSHKIFKIFSFWKWNRINNESFGLLRGGGRTLNVFISNKSKRVEYFLIKKFYSHLFSRESNKKDKSLVWVESKWSCIHIALSLSLSLCYLWFSRCSHTQIKMPSNWNLLWFRPIPFNQKTTAYK